MAGAARWSARCDRRWRTCARETARSSDAGAACRTPAGSSPRESGGDRRTIVSARSAAYAPRARSKPCEITSSCVETDRIPLILPLAQLVQESLVTNIRRTAVVLATILTAGGSVGLRAQLPQLQSISAASGPALAQWT